MVQGIGLRRSTYEGCTLVALTSWTNSSLTDTLSFSACSMGKVVTCTGAVLDMVMLDRQGLNIRKDHALDWCSLMLPVSLTDTSLSACSIIISEFVSCSDVHFNCLLGRCLFGWSWLQENHEERVSSLLQMFDKCFSVINNSCWKVSISPLLWAHCLELVD